MGEQERGSHELFVQAVSLTRVRESRFVRNILYTIIIPLDVVSYVRKRLFLLIVYSERTLHLYKRLSFTVYCVSISK